MPCCTKQNVAKSAFYITMFALGIVAPILTAGFIARSKVSNFADNHLDISNEFSEMDFGHGRDAWVENTSFIFFGMGGFVGLFGVGCAAGLLLLLLSTRNKCLRNRGFLTDRTPLQTASSKSCFSACKNFIAPDAKAIYELLATMFCVFMAGTVLTSLDAFGLAKYAASPGFFHNNINETQIANLGDLSSDMTWTIFPACLIISATSSVLTALAAQTLDACYKRCTQPVIEINSDDSEELFSL